MAAIGYGLIGAGSFGRFCLEQYRTMDQVRVVAIADADASAAKQAAAELGIEASPDVDALLARTDVDLVHIATPPFTHADLVMKALEAGKHVLCEKPLAIKMPEAEAMVARAERAGRILAVNLIMRYNPLAEAVKQILDEKLLGEPLHASFVNDAKDEPLPPDHWFWDKHKSGGIFIEHAVHFFDLFRWWLGDGRVVSAEQTARPHSGSPGSPGENPLIEQVQCTVRHDSGVCVHHYHGFTQPARMDRQAFRIVCERGDIHLREWVPTEATIDCLADDATLARLMQILPDARVASRTEYQGDQRHVTGRHKDFLVDGRFRLTASPGMDKQALYGHVIRALLADQVAAAADPNHERRITEDNGLRSLRDATRAEALAVNGAS